jgi:hypothetical protein
VLLEGILLVYSSVLRTDKSGRIKVVRKDIPVKFVQKKKKKRRGDAMR